MATMKMPCAVGSGGGGSLKDLIHSKVFDEGLTQTSITADSSNYINVSEGAVAIDTTNRKGYLYCDFTMLANRGGASSWYSVGKSTVSSSYIPSLGDSPLKSVPLITDESSTSPSKSMQFTIYSGNMLLATGWGVSATTNERYIVYAMWSY